MKTKLVKESLSPSEAVYGYASWLTSRENPITMSSHHEASIVADTVDEFIKKQNLESPRENWTDELIPMRESGINETIKMKGHDYDVFKIGNLSKIFAGREGILGKDGELICWDIVTGKQIGRAHV